MRFLQNEENPQPELPENEYMTEENVTQGIMKVKNRKSPGIDNISNELINMEDMKLHKKTLKRLQKMR